MITYGSVCSGIEAATLAWEPLGWQAAWFAEIEKFPSAVLAHRWPGVVNYGDMTLLPEYIRNGWIAAPDVLVGGTPCQAFSVAGMRKGLVDPRGALTIKFVEVANAIDCQRPDDPCVVVWENVPGVLSDKSNAFGCFLAALVGEQEPLEPPGGKWANAGCVLGPQRAAAWRILDAQYFGVAQRRRRVFVVAGAGEGFDPTQVLFERDGLRRDTAPSREAGQEAAGTLASRTGAGGFSGSDEAMSGYVVPVAPTLRAGGNATGGDRPPGTDVDTCESLICIQNALRGKSQNGLGIGAEPMYTLDAASQHAVCQPEAPIVCMPINTQIITRGDALGRNTGFGLGSETDPAFTLQAGHSHGVVCQYGDVAGSLTARHDSSPCADRGMSVVAFKPGQSADARSIGAQEGVACTLESGGGGNNKQAVAYGLTVRRLTPRECERLQGMPDDHTLITPTTADGPRYKAIGNSKAVPVVRWLGWRLHQELCK